MEWSHRRCQQKDARKDKVTERGMKINQRNNDLVMKNDDGNIDSDKWNWALNDDEESFGQVAGP